MKNNFFKKIFQYQEKNNYEFILPQSSNNIPQNAFEKIEDTSVSSKLHENLEFLEIKYNMMISKDVKTKHFIFTINHQNISAFLFYIDGMVNSQNINNDILRPFLLKNSINMDVTKVSRTNQILTSIRIKKEDIKKFIYSNLIPQNTIIVENEFKNIIPKINSGFCALFVENLDICFCIESKGYKIRNIDEPKTESIVTGSHEGFVEDLRTNTSLLRKIINNENFIIEESAIRKSK